MASPVTSKQYLFQLQLIYGAQAFTIFIFGVVAYFIGSANQSETIQSQNLLIYIFAAVIIASLSAAYFIFNLLTRRIDKQLDLKSKLQKYQSAILIRSAILEVPGLFGSVICILTGNILPLLAVAIILVIFILLRPTLSGIIRDLDMSHQEKTILENPTSVLS